MSLFSRAERRGGTFTPERLLTEMTLQRVGGTPMIVSEEQALMHSAIWAGVFLYSDLISTLPFNAYRDVANPDGSMSPVTMRTQPQILVNPSLSVSAISWRAQVIASLILRGNAWGQILTRDQFGYPTTVELEHPDRIRAEWDVKKLTKRIWVDGNEVNPEHIWHAAINLLPGSPFGLSMIGKARQSIYGGVSAATYSNEIFASGGHPTAILESTDPLTAGQAEELQTRFDQRLAQRKGRAMVMQGLKYQPIQISPADSQFIEAMKWSVGDVARFLRLPEEMIGGETQRMTYRNVESRAVDLLRYSIDPVLIRLEEALTALLPQPQYVKANRAALLRMTTAERYGAHRIALQDGWRSVNEIRELEDLPPIEDGDDYTTTPQRFPLDAPGPEEMTDAPDDMNEPGDPNDDTTDPTELQ